MDKAPPRWLPFLVLGIGLLAISFGAILARLAQGYGLPSLTIATLRLGLAALLITPLALWKSGSALRMLKPRQGLLTGGAGLFLALHFATWISSLEYTSVASSTALVTTNLLWIGIASFLLFGDRPSRLMVIGIVLSLSGSLLIFWSDSRTSAPGTNPLLGNFLAIAGSWCFSAYLLIGRRLRASLALPAYVWLAYGSAAILLLLACQASDTAITGYADAAYLVALGMAVFPRPATARAYLVQLVTETRFAHLHRRRDARRAGRQRRPGMAFLRRIVRAFTGDRLRPAARRHLPGGPR